MSVCSCNVTYAFQGESTLYSCLNVKDRLAWNRHEIWSLSDCNWTWNHNHLVHKQTLNCSHWNFRFRACVEQGVPWHSGNYRVWIHSEMRKWHDKNIQSNALYRKVFTTQLNNLKPVWLNGWVFVFGKFVYELSGCGFESSCSHLKYLLCESVFASEMQ